MNRLLLAALTLALAVSAGSAMENTRGGGGGTDPAPGHCPQGQHRVSLPEQPLRCYPNAPVCPDGTKAQETGNAVNPWLCAGCPKGLNCAGCPAGQHNVITHDWGQPYKCVSNAPASGGAAAGSGACPPGTHGVLTHSWGQPYKCVPNANAHREGLSNTTLPNWHAGGYGPGGGDSTPGGGGGGGGTTPGGGGGAGPGGSGDGTPGGGGYGGGSPSGSGSGPSSGGSGNGCPHGHNNGHGGCQQ